MAQGRVAPGAQVPPPLQVLQGPQAFQTQALLHERVRVWVPRPQLPHGCDSIWVSPAVHSVVPPLVQALHGPHSPQVQLALQLRVRVWTPSPQPPQGCMSISKVPGMQAPSPLQVSPPHVQSIWHVCMRVPQRSPQFPPLRVSPGEHSPLMQTPSSTHRPPMHI